MAGTQPGSVTLKAIILVSLCWLLAASSFAASRYAVNDGDWNDTNTWSATSGGSSGASVPGSGDVAIVEKGNVVTLTGTHTVDSLLVYNSNNANHTELTISGSLTVNGNVRLSSTSSNSKWSKLSTTGSGSITVNGNFTLYATKMTSQVYLTGSGSSSITGTIYLTSFSTKFCFFKISNTHTVTLSGGITYYSEFINKAEVILNDSATLNIAGNMTRPTNNWFGELQCDSSSTINFNGSSAQILSAKAYIPGSINWNFGNVYVNNMAGVTPDTNINNNILNYAMTGDLVVQTGTLYSGGHSIELSNNRLFKVDSAANYVTTTMNSM